jgi:hypothetical protein
MKIFTIFTAYYRMVLKIEVFSDRYLELKLISATYCVTLGKLFHFFCVPLFPHV